MIPWNKGKIDVYSKKTLLQMSRIKLGEPSHLKGKKLSEEHIDKLRKSHLGQKGYWLGKKRPSLSEETRDKMRKSSYFNNLKGENHPQWKGGVTPVNERFRKTSKYKQWAKEGKKRDDYRCFDCGERGGKLESDHIYRFSKYPHLRLEPLNHQTLCKDCHKQKTIFESMTGIYVIPNK